MLTVAPLQESIILKEPLTGSRNSCWDWVLIAFVIGCQSLKQFSLFIISAILLSMRLRCLKHVKDAFLEINWLQYVTRLIIVEFSLSLCRRVYNIAYNCRWRFEPFSAYLPSRPARKCPECLAWTNFGIDDRSVGLDIRRYWNRALRLPERSLDQQAYLQPVDRTFL